MYETHFGFHRQPFQSADASRAFFVSESICTILPQLLHALRSDLGIAVLTGVPGSGKTSLLRHLQQQLASEGRAIVCSGANLGTSADLIGVLLQASRMKAGSERTAKTIAADPVPLGTRSSVMEHMKRTAELWGPILLLIDDAQLVPLPVLNELRACTEEEWNGRDLVRCLVSAPISFEEQLARSEYAEFGRRIRCHAFLQPLKSVESIRFLQEQIELAGGRLSQVFTTPALELIATAADGIPRCLSLLADESLVVAAECDENSVTEQSVRKALSRLQHLQYNWNASPHADNTELPLSDEGQTVDEPASQVVLPPVTAVVSRHTPERATLSHGVIEFGGPSSAAANVCPSAPSVVETRLIAVVPNREVSDYKVKSIASLVSEARQTGAVEFGSPQAIADVSKSESARISNKTLSAFEVGHRFSFESANDSISVEVVDDGDILDLLNTDCEFVGKYWDGITFTESPEPTLLDRASKEQAIAASNSAANPGFFDLGDSRLSNRTSVFDRYTWLALGREVPSGTNSILAPTRTKHLMLADYGMLATNQLATLCSQTASRPQAASIDQIAVTLTTDLRLIDEISNHSPSRGTGSFEFFRNVMRSAQENPAPVDAYGDHNQSLLRVNHLAASGVVAGDRGHVVVIEAETESAPDSDAEVLVTDDGFRSVPGLKLWQDGQLIFAPSVVSISSDAVEAIVEHSASLDRQASEAALAPGQLELNAQHLASLDTVVKGSTRTQPAPQLGAGGFFTLPVPIEKVHWDFQSPGIAEDQELFPIVETLTNLRADVRHFQQTGRIPGSDSSGTENQVSPGGEPVSMSDNLISRAKRRLDDRTTVADSTVVALQMAPDSRAQRTAAAVSMADAELASSAAGNSGSSPQFSSLFTRLLENRRRVASQTETDR